MVNIVLIVITNTSCHFAVETRPCNSNASKNLKITKIFRQALIYLRYCNGDCKYATAKHAPQTICQTRPMQYVNTPRVSGVYSNNTEVSTHRARTHFFCFFPTVDFNPSHNSFAKPKDTVINLFLCKADERLTALTRFTRHCTFELFFFNLKTLSQTPVENY